MIRVISSLPGVDLAAPAVPGIASINTGDSALNAALNRAALESTMVDLDSNQIEGAFTVLASLAYVMRYYITQGKSPVSVQHRHVTGRLSDGTWLLFTPAYGVVMRCDDQFSFASQTFEYMAEYMARLYDHRGEAGWLNPNWYLGTLVDGTQSVIPLFWANHVKTAEVA